MSTTAASFKNDYYYRWLLFRRSWVSIVLSPSFVSACSEEPVDDVDTRGFDWSACGFVASWQQGNGNVLEYHCATVCDSLYYVPSYRGLLFEVRVSTYDVEKMS